MQVSYWRETCTSKDWKTGLCLDVCSDDWTSGNGTTGAVMTPCDGTERSLKWCCGINTECCNDPAKVKTLPFEFRGALPNTASSTPRPLTSATGLPSGTPTTLSANRNEGGGGGLSTGAKAGIGVGAAVGALVLIALGFLIARKTAAKKNSNNNNKGDGNGDVYASEQGSTMIGSPQPQPAVIEKQVYRHEMEHQQRAELAYSPARPEAGRKQTPSYELS